MKQKEWADPDRKRLKADRRGPGQTGEGRAEGGGEGGPYPVGGEICPVCGKDWPQDCTCKASPSDDD
jgi:hypothetical protein